MKADELLNEDDWADDIVHNETLKTKIENLGILE